MGETAHVRNALRSLVLINLSVLRPNRPYLAPEKGGGGVGGIIYQKPKEQTQYEEHTYSEIINSSLLSVRTIPTRDPLNCT